MPEISNVTTSQPAAPGCFSQIKQDIRENAVVGTFCGRSVHVSACCLTHVAAFSCCFASYGFLGASIALKGSLDLTLAGVGIGAVAPITALSSTYCVVEKVCIDRGARLRAQAVHEIHMPVLTQPVRRLESNSQTDV